MGSRGYEIARGVQFEERDRILEVGTDRGEGSTGFLAGLGQVMVTIDVDHMRLAALDLVKFPNLFPWGGRAEDLLLEWGPQTDGAPIRFAWLDGHDWPYDGEDPAEAHAYEILYRSRGQEFTREASRASHLAIAKLIAPWVPAGGIVAFDDTYPTDVTDDRYPWDGKGGDAVPYLVGGGMFEIIVQTTELVAVRRTS